MSHHHYELVSFELCPYVQRSVITLREKKVPFKRTDISLSDKPDWFRKRSPTGKVPMLIVDKETVLFESAVICEYIDETTPGSLLPDNPLLRARQRSWIEFGSTILNQIGALYCATSDPDFHTARRTLKASFERLEPEIVLPCFSGGPFQMVDAVFAPVFRYFDVFEPHVMPGIFDQLPRIRQWRANLSKRPSVADAVYPDYPEALIDFVVAKKSFLGRLLAKQS